MIVLYRTDIGNVLIFFLKVYSSRKMLIKYENVKKIDILCFKSIDQRRRITYTLPLQNTRQYGCKYPPAPSAYI